MLLSAVLCALVVLQLTTTATAQWRSCFDDSCPIRNLTFSSKVGSGYEKDLSNGQLESTQIFNENIIVFALEFAESIGVDRFNEIAWDDKTLNTLYTCGPVAKRDVNAFIYPKVNETAIYINGKEYCSWSLDINNSSLPYDLIDPPKYYFSERGYHIHYSLNQTVPGAAANYSQLPKSVGSFVDGYQYKALGSEKYLLIVRVSDKTTDFMLKVNGETPRSVEVILKSHMSINIECNFKKRSITGLLKSPGAENDLWDKIHNVTIDGNACRWSLSNSLDTIYGPIKLEGTSYELQIIENNMFVHYDKYNFRIPTSASSSLTSAKSLLIGILLSMLF